jgi:hypothetical protein
MSFERTRQHRRLALGRVAPGRALQQLCGHTVGGDDFLLHRLAHAAQLQRQHRGGEQQRQRGDDEVDLQAQAHRELFVPRSVFFTAAWYRLARALHRAYS